MKIKFNKYVELAFVYVALAGIAGRAWVLPTINWRQQLLLFVLTLILMNVVWAFHYAFNDWLNRHVPFERSARRRILIQLLGGWGVVKTLMILSGLLIVDQILPALALSINRLTLIALSTGIFLANVVISLGFIAHYLFKRWQENVLRAARLEKEKSQVQYDNLKNQLNPHFLFNSLSSLDSLIDENPVLARQFLRQLSKVFRYVLQNKDKELVSLETELAFVDNYVSLLKTRFDGTLNVSFQIAEDALDKSIVPVTLQVLIENAIKHNVINEAHPLEICAATDDAYLNVENRVQRKRQVETSNQQGLTNLRLLYSYLSQQPVEVLDDGDRFRVRVPLL
ncbi:histidine kinase [Spirosoma taeanense]|uniref:Histidine kinase n=1 Tax=Spirosoma taeanense TaxID=2735870 RepID=A0A6M5YAE2_9BACT|nr:histidine kinase [Spirosoma taeanense]QJW90191.1 histidine kinase [Spirosoma taeanense]